MNKTALILVVDDDPDICTMIKMMLEYHQYKVVTADDDVSAELMIHTHNTDLVIMDMLLSGIDGTDICRKIKRDSKTQSIPVLMFSAHPNARQACLDAGADDFIAKPFEMAEMLEKIKSLL